MLKLTFYPESNKQEFIQAANEYREIWNANGELITKMIEKVSGMKFRESFINALIFEGMSGSYPLRFRASYPPDIKKGTIVHELCHRLTDGNKIKIINRDMNLEAHKLINLILYDIWIALYGEEFAKNNVEVESGRQPFYKDAWDWALTFSKEERAKKFAELVKLGLDETKGK